MVAQIANVYNKHCGDVIFAPVNWTGTHWILVILDFRATVHSTIIYVDPLCPPAPEGLLISLLDNFRTTVYMYPDRFQYDGLHCGAWCAAVADQYLDSAWASINLSPSGSPTPVLLVTPTTSTWAEEILHSFAIDDLCIW